jgi:hypothetical protein
VQGEVSLLHRAVSHETRSAEYKRQELQSSPSVTERLSESECLLNCWTFHSRVLMH